MKTTPTIVFALCAIFFAHGCGNAADKGKENALELCRCLTEPGNTEWAVKNKDACRDLISAEIGVENWEKINLSQEPEIRKKWDAMVEKCTGSSSVSTGIEELDSKREILNAIGTNAGYIWEALDYAAQSYTTLAFDALIFRTTAYAMNGRTNSADFTKIIELSGKWKVVDPTKVEGQYEQNGIAVTWKFSADYATLTNNKGVVFKRVNVRKPEKNSEARPAVVDSISAAAPAPPAMQSAQLGWNYSGTIDRYPIKARIDYGEGAHSRGSGALQIPITGYYFYEGKEVKIPIEGSCNGAGDISFRARTSGGYETFEGQFSGSMLEDFSGTWSNGKKRLRFSLGARN